MQHVFHWHNFTFTFLGIDIPAEYDLVTLSVPLLNFKFKESQAVRKQVRCLRVMPQRRVVDRIPFSKMIDLTVSFHGSRRPSRSETIGTAGIFQFFRPIFVAEVNLSSWVVYAWLLHVKLRLLLRLKSPDGRDVSKWAIIEVNIS